MGVDPVCYEPVSLLQRLQTPVRTRQVDCLHCLGYNVAH